MYIRVFIAAAVLAHLNKQVINTSNSSISKIEFSPSLLGVGIGLLAGWHGFLAGRHALPIELRFTAGVLSSGKVGGSLTCAVNILSTILTLAVAHYCDGSSLSSLEIRVGGTDRITRLSIVKVFKITKYLNYNVNTIDYNLFVIHTATALPLQPGGVQTVRLPDASGSSGSIVGL